MSSTHPHTKYYNTALPLHAHLLLLPLDIVPVQESSYCSHLKNLTLMDTELCVYLGAVRFTIIVSVHFHDNQGSQSGANHDDKLMHTYIVLHK